MEAPREYGFINAKVRAMRSRLLHDSVYRNLISAKDEKEFLTLLSQTRYKGQVENLLTQPTEMAEYLLEKEEIEEFKEIETYTKGHSKKFFKTLLLRYDAEQFKILLRLWHGQKKEVDLSLFQFVEYSISPEIVLEAKSMEEMVKGLGSTPFVSALAQSIPLYEEQKTLFPVELAIDRTVYESIWKTGMRLHRTDRPIVHRLVGLELDLKNLDWIFRYRTYYKIAYAEIRDWLLPYGFLFRPDQLVDWANTNRLSEAWRLAFHLTDFSLEEENTTASLDALEHFLYRVLLEEARRAFRALPLSIGTLLGYFYERRIETRNLKMIFLAKRYQLPASQWESYVVR